MGPSSIFLIVILATEAIERTEDGGIHPRKSGGEIFLLTSPLGMSADKDFEM
jgi:hypothetical protein